MAIWADLVGALEHFSIKLGISSSQLTLSPSFFRGLGETPPTRYPVTSLNTRSLLNTKNIPMQLADHEIPMAGSSICHQQKHGWFYPLVIKHDMNLDRLYRL
jgi:hypothetical protein